MSLWRRGATAMSAPMINGYTLVSSQGSGIYRGPDRDPWDLVDERYYAGTLPEAIRVEYEILKSDEARGLWWPTSTDLSSATRLAEFSRQAGGDVELIGVFSPYIDQLPHRKAWEEPRARLLGLDVVSVGEWSLLRAMLEVRLPVSREVREPNG